MSVYCTLSILQGNMTNLMVHLQYHHKAEFEEVKKKIKVLEKEEATASSGAPRVPLQLGQCTITHSFELTSPILRSSVKWKTLTNSICYCIAKDMLLISTVNDTAPNLAALKDALEQWKLPLGKLFAAITDYARNTCLALENLDVEHISCFAHTVRFDVQKTMDLPEMSKAIGRAKRLVSHSSSYVLRSKQ